MGRDRRFWKFEEASEPFRGLLPWLKKALELWQSRCYHLAAKRHLVLRFIRVKAVINTLPERVRWAAPPDETRLLVGFRSRLHPQLAGPDPLWKNPKNESQNRGKFSFFQNVVS
jgi:hypothetical protein